LDNLSILRICCCLSSFSRAFLFVFC
jgi:hypothetical protein